MFVWHLCWIERCFFFLRYQVTRIELTSVRASLDVSFLVFSSSPLEALNTSPPHRNKKSEGTFGCFQNNEVGPFLPFRTPNSSFLFLRYLSPKVQWEIVPRFFFFVEVMFYDGIGSSGG